MSDRSGKNLAAKAEWDSLEGEMTMEIVNSIAAKHGVTGKLRLFAEPFILPSYLLFMSLRGQVAVSPHQGQGGQGVGQARHGDVQRGPWTNRLHGQGLYSPS